MMLSHVKYFLIFLLAFAGFFWAWAVKNTVNMPEEHRGTLDLGVVSFGSVLLTASYNLGALNSGGRLPAPSSAGGVLLQLATALVTLNYALGAFLGFTMLHRPGFALYCVIFTFLWMGIAAYTRNLLQKAGGGGGGAMNEEQSMLS